MNKNLLKKVSDELEAQLSRNVDINYQLSNYVPEVWSAENTFGVFYIATSDTSKASFSLIVDVFEGDKELVRVNYSYVPFGNSLLKQIQDDVNHAIHYLNNSNFLNRG